MPLSSIIIVSIVSAIFVAFPTGLVAASLYTRDDVKKIKKPKFSEAKSNVYLKSQAF